MVSIPSINKEFIVWFVVYSVAFYFILLIEVLQLNRYIIDFRTLVWEVGFIQWQTRVQIQEWTNSITVNTG